MCTDDLFEGMATHHNHIIDISLLYTNGTRAFEKIIKKPFAVRNVEKVNNKIVWTKTNIRLGCVSRNKL